MGREQLMTGLRLIGVQDTLWAQTANANALAMAQAGGNVVSAPADGGLQAGHVCHIVGPPLLAVLGPGAPTELTGVCIAVDDDNVASVCLFGTATVQFDPAFPPVAGQYAVAVGGVCRSMPAGAAAALAVVGVVDGAVSESSGRVSVGAQWAPSQAERPSASWFRNGAAITQGTQMVFGRIALGPAPALDTDSAYAGISSAQVTGNYLRIDWPGMFSGTPPTVHLGFEGAAVSRVIDDTVTTSYGVFRLLRGDTVLNAGALGGHCHVIAIGGA